jgi:Domain of Unknown Function (DUF1080)
VPAPLAGIEFRFSSKRPIVHGDGEAHVFRAGAEVRWSCGEQSSRSSSSSRRGCRRAEGRSLPERRPARGGLVACALLALAAALDDARAASDWVHLFDGRTLDGWVQRNGMASYRVKDGAIVGRTSEGSPNSFLATEREYSDFVLEFEVKVDDALNSGVQIRSRTRQRSTGEGADHRAGRVFGPQVEIEASPGLAGFLYGEATGRGWLTPQERLRPHEHFRNGEWNRYRVVARGPRIQTWLNGQPIEDLTDEATYRNHPEGFIGLQVHSVEPVTGPYEVAWRRLRLRVLQTSE